MSERRLIKRQMALEKTMRDVLGNMGEMVADYAYLDLGGEFETLSIDAVKMLR